ncbi:MAG: hypothetical protein L0215_20620 [Gemmataceae bacterium]|nr:hypothetical protein [Gemmataceae bacterium]
MPAAVNLFHQAEALAVSAGWRPGLAFNAGVYPPLTDYRKVDDMTLASEKGCVRRYLEFVKGKSEVRINISVHTGSIQAARTEFIRYILMSAMLPQEGYVLRPRDVGDFSVLYADEAAAKKPTTINFMRDNVGVTIWKLRGACAVPELAAQIDARIREQALVKDLAPHSPRGLKASLSRTEVEVGDVVECSASFEQREGENLNVFFLKNNRLLTELTSQGASQTWQATAPGVSPIVVMVSNSNLLTSTVDLAVKIVGEEKKPSDEDEE